MAPDACTAGRQQPCIAASRWPCISLPQRERHPDARGDPLFGAGLAETAVQEALLIALSLAAATLSAVGIDGILSRSSSSLHAPSSSRERSSTAPMLAAHMTRLRLSVPPSGSGSGTSARRPLLLGPVLSGDSGSASLLLPSACAPDAASVYFHACLTEHPYSPGCVHTSTCRKGPRMGTIARHPPLRLSGSCAGQTQ